MDTEEASMDGLLTPSCGSDWTVVSKPLDARGGVATALALTTLLRKEH